MDKAKSRRFSACVIAVSNRVHRGEREDRTGPALVTFLTEEGFKVIQTAVVPDEKDCIKDELKKAIVADVALILTAGGTGFSPRDVTPEATGAVCKRMAPGIPEAMRAASMQITAPARLSREVCGIANKTLIINLPGSPKAAIENIAAVINPVVHGLEILKGIVTDG